MTARIVIDNTGPGCPIIKKGREVANLRGLPGFKNLSVLKRSIRPSPGKSTLMQIVPREESNLPFRRKILATVAEQIQFGTCEHHSLIDDIELKSLRLRGRL
jgi:hypothetical protein